MKKYIMGQLSHAKFDPEWWPTWNPRVSKVGQNRSILADNMLSPVIGVTACCQLTSQNFDAAPSNL